MRNQVKVNVFNPEAGKRQVARLDVKHGTVYFAKSKKPYSLKKLSEYGEIVYFE